MSSVPSAGKFAVEATGMLASKGPTPPERVVTRQPSSSVTGSVTWCGCGLVPSIPRPPAATVILPVAWSMER